MSPARVCVIYDDRDRPETTGGYCLRALRGRTAVTHLRPDQVAGLNPGEFDLFVRIDDGLDAPLPPALRPLAWWAIDTHLEFDRCLAQARTADLTFAAQRPGADALRRAGVTTAAWLPLACDPVIHRPHEVPTAHDVCFVGNLIPGPRTELLELLRRHFPAHSVGRAYFDDMARTYSASRVVFNRSVRDDLNMRVFEALACGALLATNALPPETGQDELFRDGTHLATYRGPEELLDKVRFYLARPEVRAKVARTGREGVVARHTYLHRMERILGAASEIARPVSVRSAPAAPGTGGPSPGAPARIPPAADPGYFEFERPELIALVPESAADVVDVGCGAGRLGAALKARRPCRVVGIEQNPTAAAAARARLDLVLEGDAEALDWPFPPHSFDAVVCGDVLEHLRDPLALLRRARDWLRPGGVLVASLPNVRHHSVVRGLLAGDWTYEPAGLLDHTHLRFFTRREVEKLLFRAGFAVPALAPVPGPGYAEWASEGRPGAVGVGGLRIGPLEPAEAEEFYAYQWLAAASPAPRPDYGLTSIVILAHNQLPLTRACVGSIRLLTDEPYELVLVDNGSTDGTAEYLRALAAADPRVRVVRNPENRGFPVGCNQGIAVAAGAQVLLLNNDTVVTTGWLTRLLAALHAAPDVGLAGPCSNHVSGGQQIDVTYPPDTLEGLDGFAWQWGRRHEGVAEGTDRLVGFCLLIKRAVIDAVGVLDERFGLGNFEDDDYCRRALGAGFRAVVARDAFVHHVGGATFRAAGVDYVGLMRANRGLFRQKWEPEADPPVPERTAAPRAEVARPPRVLLLAHVGLFRDRMDKSHYLRYRALADRPGVTLFGPGVPGYRPGMPLGAAVAAACGGVWPEVVVHGCDPRASCVPLVEGLADAPVPTALELLDSWAFEDRQVDFVRRHRFAACLMQEAGHHLAFYRDRCPGVEFVWAPNAVDTAAFRDRGLPKEYDVILYGNLSADVYPLRARLAGLLRRQTEFRVLHLPHPGYYPDGRAAAPAVTGADLSVAINRARLGIATQSIYRCFLMKYLELAASGALVAGDLPDTARELFGADFVELRLGDSDDAILRKLRAALADPAALRARAAAVARRVADGYSLPAFADRTLAALGRIAARHRAGREDTGPVVRPEPPPRDVVPEPGGGARTEPPLGVIPNPSGLGLLLVPSPVRLSGCLIVRDNAGTIRACLESLRPWVDELVVVDTGSRDDTPSIAAQLGARVFHFPWVDDFSAARNESVRHARGEWVFWMDSDDVIDADNGRALRALALGPHADGVLGYVARVHCTGPDPSRTDDVTVVDHVKLFRNRPELRFEHRIHEQILPAIRRAGGRVAWTDLFVVHAGYDHSPEGQARKKDRDLRILHRELGERPDHPFTLFNLGMTYADVGEPGRGAGYLEGSLRHSHPGDSHRRKAFSLLAFCRAALGDTDGALGVCDAGLAECPEDIELRFRRGVYLHAAGRLREAVSAFESALSAPEERYFTSLDRGVAGFKARQNLAAVFADLGQWDRAESEWRSVTAEAPPYRAGWRGLGAVLVRRGNLDGAARLAQELLSDPRLAVEGHLLSGHIAAARGQTTEALGAWERASRTDLSDPEPLQLLARAHFESGADAAAERALRALTELVPTDAAAYHNLGSVLLRTGRAQEAASAFQRSLALRPGATETRTCLGHALRELGTPA